MNDSCFQSLGNSQTSRLGNREITDRIGTIWITQVEEVSSEATVASGAVIQIEDIVKN